MTKYRTNSDGVASLSQMQSNVEKGLVPPSRIHPQSSSIRTPGPRSTSTRSLSSRGIYVSQPSSPGSQHSSPRLGITELTDAIHNTYLLNRGIKPQAIRRVCV